LSSACDDNDGIIKVTDASGLVIHTNIQIDDEVMRIAKIDGTQVFVTRAWLNSTNAAHTNGSAIHRITEADHALVDSDDNFGFNELFSEFTDGLSRNPTTGADE
jgi:Mg2+/Co2+ transporter CorC